MSTVSNPKVNVTKASASQVQSNSPQRVLIVGQQTGSVYTSGELVQNISNNNTEINNLGTNSMLAQMVKAFKRVNGVTAVDMIPLDDNGSAVSAAGTVVFSGTATAAGSLTVNIGSRIDHSLDIAVAVGDTETVIGDALVSAIAADSFSVVTGINTAGSVAITAVNGGTVGNQIGSQVAGLVPGVTSTVGAVTGGLTDPVLTGVFDVVGNTRYQTVVYPGTYDVSELTGFLDPRFNAQNEIIDGVGVISKTASLANINVFLNTQNSQSLAVNANEVVSKAAYTGSAMFELDDVISSNVGAVRSLRLTDGANISQITIASNLDAIGGSHAASLPYFNTLMAFLPIIDTGLGFSATEISQINAAGGYVIGNNTTRTNVILGQVYSTYKTDVAGNADITYRFLNYVDTASNIAEFFFNNIRADYAQYRLTNGGIVPGFNIANEDTIRSSFIEYYQTLSGPGYILTRSGRDNIKFFADNLTLSLDLSEGKVTSIADVPLVVQLRQLDVVLKAVFNI